MPATLPTDYQSYIHRSRYARFRDDLGRREHWDETVGRYFDFFEQELAEHNNYKVPQTLRSELEDAVLNLHIMPSMRALMTAGEACRRENIAAYNCSYVPVDRPRAFAEILYILMCGTGVGFSCERQEIANLPQVPSEFTKVAYEIVVGDSKMGWADAYEQLITCLYKGQIPTVNTSQVRPAGERLKVFGGRASGPEPLIDLFEFTIRTFRHAAGRKLNSLEVHEIVCKTGEIVVVGGVRRSALISISNLSDQRMRDAKAGQWWVEKPHLALANNSVGYTEKPEVGQFMDEWTSLYRSRSGERGIFNRDGAVHKILRLGRRDHRFNFGLNPCVTGDTPLLTRDGYAPIQSLVGKDVEIWNGMRWSKVTPFSTGVNPLMRVTFSDGTDIKCTPYHRFVVQDSYHGKPKFVEAHEMEVGDWLAKFDMPVVEGGVDYEVDAYSQGSYASYEKNFVPIDASLRYRVNWLAGLLDSEGTVINDVSSALRIPGIDKEFMQQIRLMLTTMGVQAHVEVVYYGPKEWYNLLINQADTYHLVENLGLICERLVLDVKKPQRDALQFVKVATIEYLDHQEETFCVTEPFNNTVTFNGIVTGNCGEILLRPRGLCNLTEGIVRDSDTAAELREKARLASILGTWQSTLTRFNFVEPEWQFNAEEERLLGVSWTGIYDNAMMRGDKGLGTLAAKLESFKAAVVKTNRLTAYELNINPSAATTCGKPSGTVSQLVNCPSGIHQGHSEYYIRRVTGDNKDPITTFMVDAGIPHEPHATKPQQMTVFSFPVKLGEGTVTRDDVTAIQHLELVKTYNQHWAEHNMSCTISIKEHEWPSVGGWVYDHFDDMVGLSFLPHFEGDSSYTQMPYETITKEQYEEMLSIMPKGINWNDLAFYEQGIDTVTGTREFACVGNACEIVDASTPLT